MTQKGASKLREINKASEILKKGGIVIFPTDTVYGIGCAWNKLHAIIKIQRIKGSTQNFPVLVSNISQVHKIAKVNDAALNLAHKYWPGGLTIIMEKRGDGKKIGIRMPDSEITRGIIENLGEPIIGTSANFHGEKTPTSYGELNSGLKDLVDYVVIGECKNKIESTVVDTTKHPVKILREGAIKI